MFIRAFVFVFVLLLFGVQSSWAASYYISATGSDSNNCSISLPCASPNYKAVNAGDIFWVEPGSYNVSWADFGAVTGASQAHLYCGSGSRQNFGCTLNCSFSSSTITIDQPYWDVEGFVVSCNGPTFFGTCILVDPIGNNFIVHHVMVANNITENCQQNGVATGASGGFGIDYVTIQNNITYNSAVGTSGNCPSGITVANPENFDSLSGPHIIVSGNFNYSNVNTFHSGATYCDGTNITSNGGGIILSAFPVGTYTGLILIEDNINVGNGSAGITCTACNGPYQVLVLNNTSWADNTDPNLSGTQMGEMLENVNPSYVQSYNNIAQATTATSGHSSSNNHGAFDSQDIPYVGPKIDIWDWNAAYNSAVGGSSQSISGTEGTAPFGSHNILGNNPALAAPFVPSGAPPCTTSDATMLACLQNASEWGGTSIIAAFTPTNSAVVGAGSHFFCAPSDILGNPWTGKCDPGAIKVSP